MQLVVRFGLVILALAGAELAYSRECQFSRTESLYNLATGESTLPVKLSSGWVPASDGFFTQDIRLVDENTTRAETAKFYNFGVWNVEGSAQYTASVFIQVGGEEQGVPLLMAPGLPYLSSTRSWDLPDAADPNLVTKVSALLECRTGG